MHGETSVPFVNVIRMEILVFSTAVKSEWYLHVTIELGFFYTKKQIFVVDTEIVERSSIFLLVQLNKFLISTTANQFCFSISIGKVEEYKTYSLSNGDK